MHIYLVRHGQDVNPAPGYLSSADVALSGRGEQQAVACVRKLQKTLDSNSPVRIITSPKQRTLQTAQIIGKALVVHPAAIVTDSRLEERDCTPYFGQAVAQVFSQPEDTLVAGGMESYNSLYRRLASFYEELISVHTDTSVIIVTHSGNIRPLQQITQQLPPDPYAPVQELAPDNFLQLQ